MAQRKSGLVSLLAWLIVLGMVGLVAIALISTRYGWPIYLELLSHFQLQYFVGGAIGLAIVAWTRRRLPLLLGLLCVATLGSQIVPWYLPPKFLGGASGGNFRIFIANINTQNQQYAEVLALAQQENPDLALFMEVDEIWVDQLNALLPELPYSSGQANPFNLGIILYSRYPLQNTQLTFLGEDSTPSLTGQVEVNDQSIGVVGTHPRPPVRPDIFHSRNRQLDLVGQYVQAQTAPLIVIGDLNITMWSPYYKRLMRNTGLRNARDGFGLLPSWPTSSTYQRIPDWAPLLFSIPIDHCLLSPDLTVADVRVGPNIGSDHRPVIVDLQL